MGMAVGGDSHGGVLVDINITPFIDVLLVLLIIFMSIVPVVPKGLPALVPQPPKHKQQQPNNQTIVVQITGNSSGIPSYKINENPIAGSELETKLNQIFSIRAQKVMFIQGDPNLNFQAVAHVVDIGHAVGVNHIGLITPKVAAGQ